MHTIISIGGECETNNESCQCCAKLCGSSGCQPVIQVDRAALPQSANSGVLAVVLDRFWIVARITFWLFSDGLIMTLVCQMVCGTLGGNFVILVEVVAAD